MYDCSINRNCVGEFRMANQQRNMDDVSQYKNVRFAIYFAPERESDLYLLGKEWLGRGLRSNSQLELPKIQELSDAQILDVIRPAARYGFHGTLKPPFELISTDQQDDLINDLETFVSTEKPFSLPPLKLKQIGHFLALTPVGDTSKLNHLAARIVRFFDSYRRPETEEKMNQRRKAGLTSLQEFYLTTWGYPYVMDEFKFHLTLTGPIKDKYIYRLIFKELSKRVSQLSLDKITINNICLFIQDGENQQFNLHSRYIFKKC